jgi:hypothetical protein
MGQLIQLRLIRQVWGVFSWPETAVDRQWH